jgi:uncharacterized membrane protein
MPRIPVLIVALFFLIGGIAHFVVMDFFVLAMPDYLGYHKELVIISGIFELLGAIGILIPGTRLLAAYCLIALVIAVYPANIHMALHPERYAEISALFLYIRLPFQFLFVWFIWWATGPEREQRRMYKQSI